MALKNFFMLRVPKSVAITNPRINCLFYVLFVTMFTVCVWNFSATKPWSAQVPLSTRTTVEVSAGSGPQSSQLNSSSHIMCPSERSVDAADAQINAWSNLSVTTKMQRARALFPQASWLEGNPPPLQVSSTCLFLCNATVDPTRCMSLLSYKDQKHSSQVALWSARHTLRSSGPFVDSFVYLGLMGATFRIRYSWTIEHLVPTLSAYFFNPANSGDETMTQTVLINNKGVPGKKFPPGSDATLTLKELLVAAQGLPKRLLGGTELAWEVFRDGLELNVDVLCFNNDRELAAGVGHTDAEGDWNLGASIGAPVCALRVRYMRCCASFSAPEMTAAGSVTIKRAVVVRATTTTTRMVYLSASELMIALSSYLILLLIPGKVIRWFMLTCLGQLSRLYQRVIIQSFDIQREAATMAVMLMANSVSFLELSDCFTGQNKFPGISRARMKERLRAALQQRPEISDDELSAFVATCFENLRWGMGDQLDIRKSLRKSLQGDQHEEDQDEDAIDIDTFNVHCSMDNAIDLQAAVDLFDQDRRRWPLELLFTPARLHSWSQRFQRARTPDESQDEAPDDDKSVHDAKNNVNAFFDEEFAKQADVPRLDPGSVVALEQHGINVLSKKSNDFTRKRRLTLEDKKTYDLDHKTEFHNLRAIVVDLLRREMDRDKAVRSQTETIEMLKTQTSELEVEIRNSATALYNLQQEGDLRYTQGEETVSNVEKNLVTRFLELDRGLNDRLTAALSNNGFPVRESSNPGPDSQTTAQQGIQLAEVTDRLAMLDAEVKHQNILINEALKKTDSRLASLEAIVAMPVTEVDGHAMSRSSKPFSLRGAAEVGNPASAFPQLQGDKLSDLQRVAAVAKSSEEKKAVGLKRTTETANPDAAVPHLPIDRLPDMQHVATAAKIRNPNACTPRGAGWFCS
mmetsp:Transcript_98340/g.194912  ORF Transcript_98340/g.194912 Transcript_98340/m.194912 type:complete len:915 (-) Transcript_98340:70-2814(-)